MKHTINRGDVFYANLKSDGTSRQSGIRPIIVISNSFCKTRGRFCVLDYNKTKGVIAVVQ